MARYICTWPISNCATSILRVTLSVALLPLVWQNGHSQTAIDRIDTLRLSPSQSTSNQNAPSDASADIVENTPYTLNFGEGFDVAVNTYTIGSTVYDNFISPDTLIIRRTDGSRFINIWYELLTDPSGQEQNLDLAPTESVDADLIYQNRVVNAGYDNILVNEDDEQAGAQAETERVDIIWFTGVVTCEPDNAIFPVVERGGNDEVKVAAITSLDANGNPDGYSDMVSITDDDWPYPLGATVPADGELTKFDNFLLLRRQTVGQDPLPLINIGTYREEADPPQEAQTVQGVAISFTELGISPNQVVYGYSIFASDVDDAIHDLTDITTFPTDTKASDSGLDLVAGVTAAVSSDECLTLAIGPGGYKPSLSTWLKANAVDDITVNGSNEVTDWQDHWIGNNDFSTGGTNNPNYYTNNATDSTTNLNFNASVEFYTSPDDATLTLNSPSDEDGDANSDTDIDFNSAPSYTRKGINIAFRTDDTETTSRQVLFEQGGVSRGIIIYIEDGEIHASSWNRTSDGPGAPWNNSGNISSVSDTVSTDREYIITLEQNGNSTPSSGSLTVYKNGRNVGTLSGGAGLLYADTHGVELGGSDGNTQYDDGTNSNTNAFEGYISELIYCNEPSNFTVAQRNRTESYLALKYGITLNQDIAYNYVNSQGNVIFNTTTMASSGGYLEYNSDIAGIGRDDASEFEQIKSKSENDSSVVMIQRSGSFPKNNTWLIWGNDDESREDSGSETKPSLINRRIIRVWRVAEEGESGNLTLTFDTNMLDPSGTPTIYDYTLLIAANNSNGDFSGAKIISPTSLSSGILTFENVDLEGGEYFTLGTEYISCSPGGVSTNLTLWLNAGLGTSTKIDGNNVNTWLDRSGEENSPETSGNNPNYVENGINHNPSVNFDASNSESLVGDGGFNTQAYFLVTKPNQEYNNSSDRTALIGFEAAPPVGSNVAGLLLGDAIDGAPEILTQYLGTASPAYRRAILSNVYNDYNGNNAFIDNQSYLMTVLDGTTYTQMYIDGKVFANANIGSELHTSDAPYALSRWHPDNISGRSDFYDGQIAEVISFSSRPSGEDQLKIQSYLAIKYGITLYPDLNNNTTNGEALAPSYTEGDYLNSSATVIWDYSANSTYHNGVTGIGRDDGSCLEQRQSTSDYADAIVTIGHEEIATSNAANTNYFDTNNSFLIWGNDAADADAANVETTDVPTGVSERMTRVWKVQETGTVENTSIAFDLTDLGYTSISTDFKLIVSNSATMASGTTYSGGTFSNNTITFRNIDFSDGDFFTLGTATTATCGPGGVSTDLALWLKANESISSNIDGEAITSWSDLSGSPTTDGSALDLGGDVPVTTTYAKDLINFNPAVKFINPFSTNATYIQTGGGNTVEDDLTMVAVFRSGQTGGSTSDFELAPALISAGTDASTLDYGLGIAGGRVHFNADNNAAIANVRSTSNYNDHIPRIATGTRVRNGAVELYINANNVDSGTSSNVALNAPTAFGIGNHADGTVAGQFNGYIPEVLVFSKALSSSERQRVESYLAIKYGITKDAAENYLAADGTTEIWDFTEDGTYNSDIAGIGIDDNSCFIQTKSKSENPDAIVTMEVPYFNTDNSWLMWANDNVAIEGTKTDGNTEFDPLEISSRLFREWRVQKNGTVGAVTLTFDLSEVEGPSGFGTNNLTQLRLMVDDDGDFTTGTTYISPTATNATNKTVSFTVDFNDGQYYTLGSQEYAALPITLVDFTAKLYLRDQVKLDWSTASENNNAFFTLERSSDGRNFEAIAHIDGAGNSNDILYYSYIDTKPTNDFNFYRLRQNDLGGEFDYSPIRSVYIENRFDETYTLYPNPSVKGENVYIDYSVEKAKEVNLKVLNTTGNVFYNEQIQLNSSPGKLTIPTAKLPRGMLIIRITEHSNKSKILKLVLK